jgi:hypothetical protein
LNDLLDIAFAGPGCTRCVVSAAVVVAAVNTASVCVVAVGLSGIVRHGVVVGSIIAAFCGFATVTGKVIDLIAIGCL